MKATALLLAAALPFLVQAKEWWEPDVEYSFDIAGAYLSRGKVISDRPIQMNEASVTWNLAPNIDEALNLGRIGLWYWNFSELTGDFQHEHRRFVPEQNMAVTYGYDWKITDGWSVDTEVWAEWQTFHGEKPENSPSAFEWRIKQSLKNPYVTPYYKARWTLRPVTYNYYQVGLKKKFGNIGGIEGLSLTPNVAVDMADGPGLKKRLGRRPEGESGYGHAGFLSVIGEVTAAYKVTSNLSVHATIGQFGVVNRKGRGNLGGVHHRDLTYWQVGFTLEF